MHRQLQRMARFARNIRALIATTPGAMFLFFTCLYVLTYQGRTNSLDGQSMFATTRALVEHGTLSISSVSVTAFEPVGRDGLHYSKYGIGQSLAETPLYLVGKLFGLFAGTKAAQVAELVAMLTNPLIMAASCVVFYGIIRRLGYTRATAIRATLVLGIATSLWPYSKTDFSEPLLTLSLAVAVYCSLQAARLLKSQQAESAAALRDLLWLDLAAGIGLGIAVLTKYAAIIYIPVIFLYALFTLPQVSWRDLRSFLRVPRRLWLQRLMALLLPVVLAGLGVLLVNWLRFDSPFSTGYSPGDQPFSGPVLVGLWGLLISPYRGLLYYDPLLFVGLLALPLMLWRRAREALFPLGLLVGSLLFYAAYRGWAGGSAWGPRYLVPALPYLLLPLLQLGCFGPADSTGATMLFPEDRVGKWPARLIRGLTILLVTVSAVVQLLGVCVNFLMEDTYWLLSLHKFGNLTASLRASPLALSVWTLRLSLQYAVRHTFASGYASLQYPFGPPFPIAAGMPQRGGVYPLQYFWFTLLPKPELALAFGAVVLGSGMVMALWLLRRRASVALLDRPPQEVTHQENGQRLQNITRAGHE